MTPSFAYRILLALIVAAVPAVAADDCPPGNLLEGKRPIDRLDVYDVERITDGVVSPAGAAWDNDTNARLTPYGYATYDLGRTVPIAAVFLQGEASTSYTLSVSLDGVSWNAVSNVPAVAGGGMQDRFARAALQRSARYLRISSGSAQGPYSIGEAAVWCRPPLAWPPGFETRAGEVRDAAWSAARKRRIGYGKLVYLALGTGLLLAARRFPRRRLLLYGAVILGGALAWTNFGSFHGPNFIHYHEAYHYYLGSKYFEENGYTGLYACTVLAERDLGLEAVARNRYVTNLENNLMTTGDALLESNPPCRERFTAERWQAFREDVRYFRNHLYPGSWQRVFRDHGYNPSPVWTVLGKAAGALGSTASTAVPRVVWIDVLLWLGIGALILWGFGVEALALTALTLGGGLPWFYDFTGGAFLRFGWLACLVAGVCLLKKERPFAGGFALASAAALRVFPAVFLGVLVMAALVARYRGQPLRDHLRLFYGAASAGIVAILLTLAVLGPSSWIAFAENTRKHAATPVGNLMGLPAVVAFDPATSQDELLSTDIESLDRWRLARAETLRARRVVLWPLAAVFVGLCAWTVARRRYAAWEWVLVSILLAVSLGQISSYYYVFLILLALWAVDRPLSFGLLVAALAASLAIGLAGLATDVQYFWLSLLFVALPVAMWLARVRDPRSLDT
jgi:hypothetical protein